VAADVALAVHPDGTRLVDLLPRPELVVVHTCRCGQPVNPRDRHPVRLDGAPVCDSCATDIIHFATP
jgi:hypothetical protein